MRPARPRRSSSPGRDGSPREGPQRSAPDCQSQPGSHVREADISVTTEELYALLPAVYRLRDAELGHPLRGLVAILAEQAEAVDADIERLYDNWFIETADRWAVPYIGDLLRVGTLATAAIEGEPGLSALPRRSASAPTSPTPSGIAAARAPWPYWSRSHST